eukprot:1572908-Rhodomonas_salina.1
MVLGNRRDGDRSGGGWGLRSCPRVVGVRPDTFGLSAGRRGRTSGQREGALLCSCQRTLALIPRDPL